MELSRFSVRILAMRYILQAFILWLLVSNPAWATLSIDGTVTGATVVANANAITLSTSDSNDVIVIYASNGSNNGCVTGVSDVGGANLTWTKRKSQIFNGTFSCLDEWYAVAPSPLVSDLITVSWSSTSVARATAFGIHGANNVTPFDANVGLPASSGVGGSVTVSTSNANDMLIGYSSGNSAAGNPAGWSAVIATGANANCGYDVVSSTQSSASITFQGSNGSQGIIIDAVQQAASTSSTNCLMCTEF